jgi:hypothetical protein
MPCFPNRLLGTCTSSGSDPTHPHLRVWQQTQRRPGNAEPGAGAQRPLSCSVTTSVVVGGLVSSLISLVIRRAVAQLDRSASYLGMVWRIYACLHSQATRLAHARPTVEECSAPMRPAFYCIPVVIPPVASVLGDWPRAGSMRFLGGSEGWIHTGRRTKRSSRREVRVFVSCLWHRIAWFNRRCSPQCSESPRP